MNLRRGTERTGGRESAFGERQVSTIYTPTNDYQVILETLPQFQEDPAYLSKLRLKTAGGQTIPIESFLDQGRILPLEYGRDRQDHERQQRLRQAHERHALLARQRVLLHESFDAGAATLGAQRGDQAAGRGCNRSCHRLGHRRRRQKRGEALALGAAVGGRDRLPQRALLTDGRRKVRERGSAAGDRALLLLGLHVGHRCPRCFAVPSLHCRRA